MAVTVIEVNGSAVSGDGVGLTAGTIVAELSQPASAPDGSRVVGKVVGLIANGTVSSLSLAANDALTPAGTYWNVVIDGATADGQRYHSRTPEKWQLASSPATVAIGDVPRLSVVPGVALGLPAATSTTRGGIRLTNDLGGTADAPTVTATHLAAPLPEAQGGTGAASLGAATVTATGRTTARSLSDWLEPFDFPDWDQTPYIVAHRGMLDLYAPENTWEAFEQAAATGAAFEIDGRASADGIVIGMHDLTTTRTTGVTATVAEVRFDDLRRMNAAAHEPWATLTPYRWLEIPTLHEFLSRYGGKHLTFPQLEDDTPGAVRLETLERISRAGMYRTVVIQSFSTTVLDEVYATDPRIRTVLVGNDLTTAVVATATAHHAWGIATSWREATAEWVTDAKAAGLKVFLFFVNDVQKADEWIALGVDGILTDDPAYMTQMLWRDEGTPLGFALAVPVAGSFGTIDTGVSATYGTVGSGWRGRRAGAGGTFKVLSGWATFDIAADGSASAVVYPGIRTPEAPWSLTMNLKCVAASSDASRYIGIRIGRPGDNDAGTSIYGTATSGNGYNFFYRQNGTVSLERVNAGSGTQIATTTWNAITTGSTVELRVDVTSTTITVTRVDNAQTISATDSQKSRAGFVSAFASGAIVGVGTCRLNALS